jgi:hypothetical protein
MKTSYFSHITTLEELNKEWKRLMLLHHPDRGGSEETTKEINSQRDKREKEIELGYTGNSRSYDYQRAAYKHYDFANNYWSTLFKDFEKKYDSAKSKEEYRNIIFDDHTVYATRYAAYDQAKEPLWIAVIAGTQEEYLRYTKTLPYETARECRFISCEWECEGKFFSEIITTGTWYDLDLNFKLLHILKERLVR